MRLSCGVALPVFAVLHNSKGFPRWEEASEIGIKLRRRNSLPDFSGANLGMTLLSAQATPIAQRFEIWVPNADRSPQVEDAELKAVLAWYL